MPKKQSTAAQRARQAARAGGKYTTSLRAETTRAADPFGGHEFEYEQHTDLFRCSECRVYEVSARADDGTITRCPGLAGYGGDTERVYLLLTEDRDLPSWIGTALASMVRETGIGRAVGFGGREDRMLVESAPSVVDDLADRIERTIFTGDRLALRDWRRAATGTRPVVEAITRLDAETAQIIRAEGYLAYVADYGEPEGGTPRGLDLPAPIRTSGGIEFTPHPAARPTILCGACERDRVVLVAVESAGALRWVYACPACGTQTTGWRRDPHDRPPFAYLTVMPWTIDRRPTDTEPRPTPATADYLAALGQVFDVLAALPVHDSGSVHSQPLPPDATTADLDSVRWRYGRDEGGYGSP